MSELIIAERTFEIGEPNAVHVLRMLAVIGRVGTRAENVAANLGKSLISQIIPSEEGQGVPNLANSLFPFLAALQAEDLLALMAALLQFDDEQEGLRWLRKHPPTLPHVVQALTLNLQHIEGITAALANFTTTLNGLNLAGLLVGPPQPEVDG